MTTQILIGDALAQLKTLPAESVHCCVTSPPYYGLRDYGTAEWVGGDPGCPHEPTQEWIDKNFNAKSAVEGGSATQSVSAKGRWYQQDGSCRCGATRKDGQIGLEPTPEAHIAALVEVFREVRRVLRKDGVCFMNYGDAYASTVNGRSAEDTKAAGNDDRTFRDKPFSTVGGNAKPKDLLMMPARVALALQADGWWIRSMMPWVKRSAMPESVTDRPATAIEYVFMLAKSARYFWDGEAVRQNGAQPDRQRNDRVGGVSWEGVRHSEGSVMGQSASRNFRNSDLFYASLEPPYGLLSGEDGPLALDVNPAGFSESHFATFPPKLIEPLIKAATSEKGCCPACGAPWVREVERTAMVIDRSDRTHEMGRTRSSGTMLEPPSAKTLGWSPSCECGVNDAKHYYCPDCDVREHIDNLGSGCPKCGETMIPAPPKPVPCIVLDPFGGAGTTALVADRLGRDAVLIELNPEYAEMARKRIHGDAPLFAEVT